MYLFVHFFLDTDMKNQKRGPSATILDTTLTQDLQKQTMTFVHVEDETLRPL